MSTLESVGAAMAEPLQRTRQELQRRLAGRPLALAPPPGCPGELADRIAQYNAAVEETLTDLQHLEIDAAGLPALVLDGEISAEDIAQHAQNIRINRLNALRSLRWDIEHRAALAQEIIQVLDGAGRDADEALTKATAAAEKGFAKIGVDADSMPAGRSGANPQAAARQLAHRVAEVPAVGKAQATLQDLRAQHDALETIRRGTAEDRESVEAALLGALQALVGRLT